MIDAIKNKELRDKAVNLGLCDQWQGLWSKDWDDRKMIERYKEGIDFCLANDFPSVEYIKSHFSKEELRKGGLFMDDKHSVLNAKMIVVRGRSDITARYNGNTVAEVYITDVSKLRLYAKNHCHVVLHILGDAQVEIEQEDDATVLAIRHSKTCGIHVTKGSITEREEYTYLKDILC
jgi:hypothetical protein